nr:DNA-3-methyladenine glycosylase I [uncultured Campylobacter sp.]
MPKNAKAFLELCAEFGSFYNYIYKFTNGKRVINDIKSAKDLPASSELSPCISKDMKIKFVGALIIYSSLQGVGVTYDHENECFCKGKI